MYDNLTRTELEFAYREAEKRIAELEDERSDLDMIAKNYAIKIANLKKSCDETQELLDKQIEATYKLVKESVELEKENESLTNVKNIYIGDLLKAKKIIKDLLGSENTSCEEEMFFEIRQKAEQFLSCKEILNNSKTKIKEK